MNIKRLARAAVLTAVALGIFIVELQLPHLAPIPGVKLGLANIVTVFAMFLLGPGDALAILLARILLGSLFSGQVMALAYSLAGGLLCYLLMLPLRRILTEKQIWVCGALGAAAHNIGQMAVALFVTGTTAILIYLPVLMVSGILAGLFTGLCAQFAVRRLQNGKFLR